MTPGDFELLANVLKERSGLSIGQDKVYLLESRLTPVARRNNLDSLEALVAEVRAKRSEALLCEITEAMTTNESFFFRDIKPFEIFETAILPKLLAERASRKSLRIWSAACSTGQEAYSLAMILREMAPKLAGWRIEIVGTDISNEVLEKAKAGIYSQFEVQRGLPVNLLMKYFTQVSELWQIDAAIRAMVTYKEFNLLKDLKSLGSFDIIFCRNVLIYFDKPTKTKVLDAMSGILAKDGCLFMGAAETVLGISDIFQPVTGNRGVYDMKNGAPAAAAAQQGIPARAAAG
ncbi:MAG: protein-glutamate O-methyltransferase [Alphaproteobacteria bacterium]|nr:protein-glutamate O-methyltransferase [Alphaproteobacteria bacterium]